MFKHLRIAYDNLLKKYGVVGILLVAGSVAVIGSLVLFGTSSGAIQAQENENTFMNYIANNDWWGGISAVYVNCIGGVFWAIMVLLPVGMLYIKSRNIWPPTMLLIIGSAVFGVLFGSVVRVLMIIFIAFGIAIVLYKTFSKSGGGA
jgi:hypothetical protein